MHEGVEKIGIGTQGRRELGFNGIYHFQFAKSSLVEGFGGGKQIFSVFLLGHTEKMCTFVSSYVCASVRHTLLY